MMDRRAKTRFCLALAGTLAASATASAEPPAVSPVRYEVDRVVAVVGDHFLFMSEVDHRLKPFLPRVAQIKDPKERNFTIARARADLVRMMVDETLVAIECKKLKIEVTDAEVDQATQAVAKRNDMTATELVAEIKKQNMTPEDYAAEIRRQIFAGKWMQLVVVPRVEKRLTVDPKLAEAAFEAKRRDVLDEIRRRSYVEVRL